MGVHRAGSTLGDAGESVFPRENPAGITIKDMEN
jgi:hypothetical protein